MKRVKVNPMTPAVRNAWLARLEDPQSKQCFGMFFGEDEHTACAIGHYMNAGGSLFDLGLEEGLIVRMNDQERRSLPEIAAWVRANVPESVEGGAQ